MAVIIGFVSQKGGVGKSTLSRLLACEFAGNDWDAKIADLDISQGTSYQWGKRRHQNALEPTIRIEAFGRVSQALCDADQFDALILDGAPHSTENTKEIARVADFLVLPTGLSVDDLMPGVLLAHELVKMGIAADKLVFALCRVGDSPTEIEDAREYISQAGYKVLDGEIPERVAYRRACDEGRAVTETYFKTLNAKADKLAQSIIDAVSEAVGRRAA